MFSKKIAGNALFAFPAVLLAELCGRGFFLLSVTVFARFTPFTAAIIWGQIKTGLPGLLIQALIIPAVTAVLSRALNKER